MDVKPHEARELVGRPLHDAGGERLGEISGVYFNDAGRNLEWVSFAIEDGHRFVPAADVRGEQDRLTLPFSQGMLANQPPIEAHDGALSAAQVARLHEFFQTFDGRSRITTASEGEPAGAAVAEASSGGGVPLSGRSNETTFGTGAVRPGEPHDVTLQGNGNSAP